MIKDARLEIKDFSKGFTLIELLWSIAIGAILSTIGIAAFLNYSKTQALSAAVGDVSSLLQLAKSRAQSQVKPDICGNTEQFNGYQVVICSIGSCLSVDADYELDVMCGGVSKSPSISKKKFPTNITVDTEKTTVRGILFNVISGNVTFTGANGSGDIFIKGYGMCKEVSVKDQGVITTKDCD